MFDKLRELKAQGVNYEVVREEKSGVVGVQVVSARLRWTEFHPYTGNPIQHEDRMDLEELKQHKANLEARLAAINEAIEIAEAKTTEQGM